MNYFMISTDVSLTLMGLRQNGDFAPSDVMTYQYFFLVPESFTANIVENSKRLMRQIYDEHYQNFKLSEPDDPNYIAVLDVEAKILTANEYAFKPWLNVAIPMWEDSNCIFMQKNSYQKLEPEDFGRILGIWKRNFTNTTVI